MHATIFFAGSARGPNARGDGAGLFLATGWYVRQPKEMGGRRLGPFRSKAAALAHPDAVNPVIEATNRPLRAAGSRA